MLNSFPWKITRNCLHYMGQDKGLGTEPREGTVPCQETFASSFMMMYPSAPLKGM